MTPLSWPRGYWSSGSLELAEGLLVEALLAWPCSSLELEALHGSAKDMGCPIGRVQRTPLEKGANEPHIVLVGANEALILN